MNRPAVQPYSTYQQGYAVGMVAGRAQAMAAMKPPSKPPAVATGAADDDPVERLAREIADLSQPDAKRLLRIIEEQIT